MKGVLLISILFSLHVIGQTDYQRIKKIDEAVGLLTCDSIPFEDLNQIVNNSTRILPFNNNTHFTLCAKYHFEYEDIFGSHTSTKSTDPLAYCETKIDCFYKLADIKNIFDIDQVVQLNNTNLLPSTFFYERGAEGNSTWHAYQTGTFLIIRYVHNYPNGNMTTFSTETRFYFKQAN